ncbi:Phosphopentomutase [Clostridium bornimense]|uniref:Phosphopentomutase n=1 Tax=Clostridium bornimense TaxID=1216932 RepID=W6RW35_9CLOT|nr:phosphopentomutase [Clostridium bornimense]CDM68593.1 Phosphopentomutase [Clostridium bornimense]
MTNRVILIVLDSVGIGELPDANKYNDVGSNTIGNISSRCNGINLANLSKLGIGNIQGIKGLEKVSSPMGAFGKCAEASNGKDTITGHWEIGGVILEKPLKTYPNGFPERIIKNFENKIGRKIIGNKVASGTEILEELGEEHIKTGYPIVYTSADSVFQIAAHEDVISVDELYRFCEIARNMLIGDDTVGRVIARPFIGEAGHFKRTAKRHDYALEPFSKTFLEYIKDSGMEVDAVGKINDIYCGKGITSSIHTKNNEDGINKTIELMKKESKGLIFTNLVDFDMLYGHRNDVEGYKSALEYFDMRLPEIMENINDDDVLIITADHGCDPTTESTDHSREYIPLIVYGKDINENVDLGIRDCFCDIGKTILDLLNIDNNLNGVSFKDKLVK